MPRETVSLHLFKLIELSEINRWVWQSFPYACFIKWSVFWIQIFLALLEALSCERIVYYSRAVTRIWNKYHLQTFVSDLKFDYGVDQEVYHPLNAKTNICYASCAYDTVFCFNWFYFKRIWRTCYFFKTISDISDIIGPSETFEINRAFYKL